MIWGSAIFLSVKDLNLAAFAKVAPDVA